METFWFLVDGLVQLFGWLCVAFVAFILLWMIWDYLKISCVMFFVLLRNVCLKKDYLKKHGYKVFWLTFLGCFKFSNFTGASGGTVHYEFKGCPADLFRIKFDFQNFLPKWTVTKNHNISANYSVTAADLISENIGDSSDTAKSLKEELLNNDQN
jgi:hypothetical protein